MFDCPKCVTVCKQPHCVTHCQAPKPECEPVCEEPKCDWKCHKPACPKPKCELVCENPNCVPKVECCQCGLGVGKVAQPFPFFKETETNSSCCSCGAKSENASEGPQVFAQNPGQFNTMPSTNYVANGSHFVKVDKSANIQMLKNPVPLGTAQLTSKHAPHEQSYEKMRTRINIDKIYKEKHESD
jgi:hypothetical protein